VGFQITLRDIYSYALTSEIRPTIKYGFCDVGCWAKNWAFPPTIGFSSCQPWVEAFWTQISDVSMLSIQSAVRSAEIISDYRSRREGGLYVSLPSSLSLPGSGPECPILDELVALTIFLSLNLMSELLSVCYIVKIESKEGSSLCKLSTYFPSF
jgi:hypothetical protein